MRFVEFKESFADVKKGLDKEFGHDKPVATKTTGQQIPQLLQRLKKWITSTQAALQSENSAEMQQHVNALKKTDQDFEQGKIPPDEAMEKFIELLELIGPVDKMAKAIDMMIPMLNGMKGMSGKPTEERDLQNTINALEKFRVKINTAN